MKNPLKILLAFVFVLFASTLHIGAQTPGTQLTGTLNNPDGSGFNGNLYLSITQASAISAGGGIGTGEACGGPSQVVPTQQLNILIANGTMVSWTVSGSGTTHTGAPAVFGSDCTVPQGVPYNAVLRDPQGNVMYNTQWLITGPTQNIGALYSTSIPQSTSLVQVVGFGVPADPCADNTQYLQADAAAGSNIWSCVNGNYAQQTGTPGATGINAPISGGVPWSVLFVSPLSTVDQDNANFNYVATTHTLNLTNLSVTNVISGSINGNSATTTKLSGVPAVCTLPNIAQGVDQFGNAICTAVPLPSGIISVNGTVVTTSINGSFMMNGSIL